MLPCGCVICDNHRAANALHLEGASWHTVSLSDADLQFVIARWAQLPKPIRAAVVALIECDVDV